MPFNRMRSGRNQQRFRGGMGNVIQSVKNCFQATSSIIASTNVLTDLVTAVDVGSATKVTGIEVPTGAKVFSIELWIDFISGSSAVTGTFDWYIAKSRSGQAPASTFPDPQFTDVGLSALRNQVFHQETTIFGTEDAGAYRFHRRIKIPKIYHRVRAGDKIFVMAQAQNAGTFNIAVIYKYYQ